MASLEVVPPGYDPVLDAKPKTKSAKRNERKKEKRLQVYQYTLILVSFDPRVACFSQALFYIISLE